MSSGKRSTAWPRKRSNSLREMCIRDRFYGGQNGCPAASGGQPDVQLVLPGHFALPGAEILRIAVGVHAVGEVLHAVAAFAQEREVDLHVAARPVGDGADVPPVAVAACHGGVFAGRGVQRRGLVPDGGHGGDEAQMCIRDRPGAHRAGARRNRQRRASCVPVRPRFVSVRVRCAHRGGVLRPARWSSPVPLR